MLQGRILVILSFSVAEKRPQFVQERADIQGQKCEWRVSEGGENTGEVVIEGITKHPRVSAEGLSSCTQAGAIINPL